MVSTAEDISRYYALLKDKTRRRIIEILGTQEKIGFKELRETLGLGVGTVYYHLDMLSDFLAQDKQRKYKLNDRGKVLYKVLKEGNVPASLEIIDTFSHRVGKWVFLSPIFARTGNPMKAVPLSIAVLLLGAYGAAQAKLDNALFFFFPYSSYGSQATMVLYVTNWIGLFFFVDFLAYAFYRRVGNDLQLFVCLGIASLPTAIFPYVYVVTPETLSQYILVALQVWSLMLVSAAVCFGKGTRLDKAVVVSLVVMYINIIALFISGRFA